MAKTIQYIKTNQMIKVNEILKNNKTNNKNSSVLIVGHIVLINVYVAFFQRNHQNWLFLVNSS